MITKLEIDGFKSFRDFSIEFSPFTVVAGKNASGKSNLFDALELLSRCATYDLRMAFPERRGTIAEQFTLLDNQQHGQRMKFAVELLVDRFVRDNWGREVELNFPRLRYELGIGLSKDEQGFETLVVEHEALSKIPMDGDTWALHFIGTAKKQLWKVLKSGGTSNPFIDTNIENNIKVINVRQDGKQGNKRTFFANKVSQTVLSSIESVDFPHIFAVREELRNWRFMQLSPDALRQPTKQDAKLNYEITHIGENLAAALYRIKSKDEYNIIAISRLLNKFLPEYVKVDVINDSANKQFIIELTSQDNKTFTSRVLSEGTLRLLALCIMQYDDTYRGLLCFEEPENGIHPQRIRTMIQLLEDMAINIMDDEPLLRQVIVNTHSPNFVTYLAQNVNDPNVSVWLSKMVPCTIGEQGHRSVIRCSRIAPIQNSPFRSLFRNEDINITSLDLADYLS